MNEDTKSKAKFKQREKEIGMQVFSRMIQCIEEFPLLDRCDEMVIQFPDKVKVNDTWYMFMECV